MAGKRASSRPSPAKAGRAKNSSKTRSSASLAKPKAGAPKIRTKTQKEAQKARDAKDRDQLNGAELELRRVLRTGGEAAPVVDAKAALDLPSELERQGDGLAGALRMMEVTV